jgi:hypothetical protein
MKIIGILVINLIRFVFLTILYFAIFAFSGKLVAPYLPAMVAEPGPFDPLTGIVIVSAACTLVIILMIESSRWYGWKLAAAMSLAYYGAVTFVTQLEAWYFLYGKTIGSELMPRLFLQGIPAAFLFIPLAVVVLWRVRKPAGEFPPFFPMPVKEWAWKLAVIILAYWALYHLAGYFIAWQNPELRLFYNQPGPVLPFFKQMQSLLVEDPWLNPYQALRALIWTACALPILRGSRWNLWQTALVVGLLFSVPQNIGHILPNSLIPLHSVRMSHLLETASSTFVFGLIVTWLLFPKKVGQSNPDLAADQSLALEIEL